MSTKSNEFYINFTSQGFLNCFYNLHKHMVAPGTPSLNYRAPK